jgi:hypothetical protein
MAEGELRRYPRGQLSFGPGDLTQAETVRVTSTNNGKLKHTLKRSPSGRVLGTRELTFTFDVIVDEDGPEREYFDRVRNGSEVSMRLKIPTITRNIIGMLTSIDVEVPLDDAVKLTVSGIGKWSE